MTAPTTVRPVGLRSDGDIQEMTDSDMADTVGTFVRNLRATAGEIGSYQLRSATQGAPTDAGTWTAVGTATDTKKIQPKHHTLETVIQLTVELVRLILLKIDHLRMHVQVPEPEHPIMLVTLPETIHVILRETMLVTS